MINKIFKNFLLKQQNQSLFFKNKYKSSNKVMNAEKLFKDAEEVVWIVDQNDNELGSATRQQVRDKILTHRVTYIFLRNSEDKYWLMSVLEPISYIDNLLQINNIPFGLFSSQAPGFTKVHKRTMQKSWCPGHYDLAFGGVIGFQENYKESAERELQEEAGVKCELKEQFKMYFECETSKNFGMIYTAQSDGPLKLQESEVESVHLMSKDEILKRSNDPQEKFAPDTLQAFKQLHEKIDKGELYL